MATATRTAGLAQTPSIDKCQCVFGVCRILMTTVNELKIYLVLVSTSTGNLHEK